MGKVGKGQDRRASHLQDCAFSPGTACKLETKCPQCIWFSLLVEVNSEGRLRKSAFLQRKTLYGKDAFPLPAAQPE